MKINYSKFIVLLLFLNIVFILHAFSQINKNPDGEWTGSIIIPDMDLDVIVKFHVEGNNINGTIDKPKQNAVALPLANIEIEDAKISFEIKDTPGRPTFEGIFENEGKIISGDFLQGGQNFKFRLIKKSDSDIKSESEKINHNFTKIKTFVDTVMKSWNIPGMAIGIIKDGKLVFAEGFGYRNLKDKLPVTKNALFAIGSCTKAFTTAGIGILLDEMKTEWDKPVNNYYPTFKMYDNFATEKMTFRDLVTHRSGLPRHDLVWYGSGLTRKEKVDRLQYLEPTKDFRTTFQYQNLMYMPSSKLNEFKIKDLSGFSVLFYLNANNDTQKVTFIQPNGNFTFIKKNDSI